MTVNEYGVYANNVQLFITYGPVYGSGGVETTPKMRREQLQEQYEFLFVDQSINRVNQLKSIKAVNVRRVMGLWQEGNYSRLHINARNVVDRLLGERVSIVSMCELLID